MAASASLPLKIPLAGSSCAEPRSSNTRMRNPKSSRVKCWRSAASSPLACGDTMVFTRPAASISFCNRASGTNIAFTAPCCGRSANSPIPAAASAIFMVNRMAGAAASLRPKTDSAGISVGFSRRSSSVSPGAAPNSAANSGLNAASRFTRPGDGTPWNFQKRSSTPYTATPAARRPLDCRATMPSSTSSGAAEPPNSAASCSRNNVPAVTTDSTLPSRSSASRRKLARTDSPTSKAPANTATAVATPATTARLDRR